MKLEPAMDGDVEAEAVRLAELCASCLLTYYATERDGADSRWTALTPSETYHAWRAKCDQSWKTYEGALDRFKWTFPRIVDWRELVPQTVLEQLKRSRP